MYTVGKVVVSNDLVDVGSLRPDCAAAGAKVAAGGAVTGTALQCYFEAFVRLHVLRQLGMRNTGGVWERGGACVCVCGGAPPHPTPPPGYIPPPGLAPMCPPTARPFIEGNGTYPLQGVVRAAL